MLGLGAVEFILMLFPFFFGAGLPTGMPPGPDDPALMALISSDHVGFAYWPGMAAVDGNANPTEKFMAQPELAAFVKRAREALLAEVKESLVDALPESIDSMAAVIDELAWGPMSRPTLMVITDENLLDRKDETLIGIALVNQLGEKTAEIEKHFKAWSTAARKENADSVTTENGAELIELKVKGPMESFLVTVRDGYLLFGTDRKWMANCVLKNNSNVAKSELLAKIEKELPVERRSSIAYLEMSKVKDLLPARGDPIADLDRLIPYLSQQLENLQSISFVTGLDSRGFLTRAKFEVKAGESVMNLLPSRPLSPELLEALPGNLTGGIAMRLSPAQFLDDLKVQVESATGEGRAFEQMLESSNDFLGVKLREELLEVMDDFAFFYSKFNMADPVKGWVLGVRLRDEMSFQDMLNRINIRVGEFMQNNGMQFREVVNNGVTIHSIQTNDFGLPTEFSYALVEKYLVFSLDAATIGNFVRNLRREDNFSHKPAVEALFADCERYQLPRPTMIAELDTAAIANLLFPLAMQFLGNQPLTPGGKLVFNDLPSVEVLTDQVAPNLTALFKTETGFQVVHRQTYPGTSPLPFAGAALAFSVPMSIAGQPLGAVAESQNNVRQLILAAHNHESAYQKLPPSFTADAEGKPLLSWRVKILPFLEEQELYEQFHHDEPWDSEHNLKLAAKMPDAFKHPRMKLAEGKTVYLGVTGKDGILVSPQGNPKAANGRGLNSVVDGTSNTVMIVEVAEKNAVTWTAPGDFDFEQHPGNLAQELAFFWGADKKAIVGMADGSVYLLKPNFPEKELRALMTCSGSEVIDFSLLNTDR
jgi:Protein of unknown function (DUF1559)/Protein of unknown function (DUF3352)